jgi:magnesium chelatase family protein
MQACSMLAKVSAAAVFGIDAIPVSVEVDVTPGLPLLTMVGLPDTTVRESRDRVRTAIRNSGFPFPSERVTVSLAPADVRKVGAAFDLPIALGVLAASGLLPHRESTRFTIVGGLSLDGRIPPMRGLLPIAVSARQCASGLVFPAGNLQEAGIVEGLPLFPVSSLLEAARVVTSPNPLPAAAEVRVEDLEHAPADDLAEVRGQLMGRRALEIAAAGAHHLLFSGPPGAGKTMLARRLPGLLPPLSFDEALTVTTIHSVAGLLPPGGGLLRSRPFRAPHHTCSDVSLVGGGSIPRPGELSLAHGGVLFLDELPEFSRRVLETLRQPLEQGVVHIARAARSASFPAEIMLVAAMNPCPCGFATDRTRTCRCAPGTIERYQRRLSGPLRDRFDLTVEVQAVPWKDVRATTPNESTRDVRRRVMDARAAQQIRQGCLNGRLDARQVQRICRPADKSVETLLGRGVARLGLSVRGVTRVLRIARTIADLAGSAGVERPHLAEALEFRASEGLADNRPHVPVVEQY